MRHLADRPGLRHRGGVIRSVAPLLLSLLPALTPAMAIDPHGAAAPVSPDMCTTPPDWAPPFTRTYRLQDGATVIFVGVAHSQDLTDATHRQIRAAIERYKPAFVLVEGASSAKSVSAWYRADLANAARQKTEAGSAPETLYAVALAVANGAQFSGWDFSPDQDYRVMVDDGFTLEDALGAHLLRGHVDPLAGDAAAGEVARQVHYAAMVRPIAGFDYAGWYRKAYGDRYDPSAGTPCGTGIASRAVRDLSYRRNLNMVSLIERHAVPGQTILVEAGANHWLAVRDWLRSRSANQAVRLSPRPLPPATPPAR